MDHKAVAQTISSLTNKGTPFPWPRNEGGRLKIIETLAELLPREDVAKSCLGNSNEAMNRNLRLLISPYLKANDQSLKAALSVWIVKEWGGIKRGTDAIPDWCNELSDFTDDSMAKFVTRMGTFRISSWSKILAFAAPSTDAIYDARTAVSLNCALHTMGINEGFFMPLGRNKDVNPASVYLKKNKFKEILGYHDYISLLKEMASIDEYEDILDVEMSLFANAPSVANSFLTAVGS